MSKTTLFSGLLSLIFCITMSIQVNAQDAKTVKEVYRPLTKTEISAGLNYSETQKQVLGQHYQTYLKDMHAIRDSKDFSPEEKAAAYSKVKADYKSSIISAMTKEQYESYMAVEKVKEQARKEKMARIEN